MTTFTPDCIRKVDFKADAALTGSLRKQWQDYIKDIGPYPGGFSGKGIVICAGGITYLTCAWINITLLRKHGCTLPVEIWHAANELNEEVAEKLKALGVQCRNCKDYTNAEIESYILKPFAILHSSFREVLFLDADNNCLADPSFLFESEAYLSTGTVFWPDFWTTDRENPIWQIIGSDDFDSVEQESGQLIVNKERCWKELNLCLYFNLNREYYYRMLLGDKDTFRFAWMALGSRYYMMPTPVGFCGFNEPEKVFHGLTMVQHDFSGNIIFLHRNWFKWDITMNDEPVWMEIKRFKPSANDRRFGFNYLTRGNFRFKFWDIMGDIDCLPFRELFGDYELQCLKVLQELRNSGFYIRFLLHMYLVHFRPGYASGFTGRIFSDPGLVDNIQKQVSIQAK